MVCNMGDADSYYDKICRDRFDKLEKRHDQVVNAVNSLITKVENGLTHRTKRIEKLIWVIITGIVVEGIITRIFG